MWKQGEGSEAVTRYVLSKVNVSREVRDALDNSAEIPQAAQNFIDRDRDWFERWGVGRSDLERFRSIIAAGRGWVGRLEQELKNHPGTLPVIAAAFLGGLGVLGQNETKHSPSL